MQEDYVHQVSTEINAGGSVAVSAGQNLAVISSRITAGDEAYLVAGDELDILAAQDSDYSLYDKKSKGSFGRNKTKRDEVTHVTNIGSEITSGGNMMLVSGGDQHYQVARLESGKDLTVDSGGAITFEGVKDLHQESHEKSNSSLAWTSMSGKGRTDETLRQSELLAKGNLVINAVDGLHIDVKRVNRQTVSQAIDAMVKADPDLAWLKDAEKRGDVDWRIVREIHQSFKYSNSGLGAAAQLAIAVVLAAFVGPAAMSALSAAGAGTALAAGGAAIATSAATTATTSLINNRGDLGAILKDTTSSTALEGYAVGGITAGLTAGLFDGMTGTKTDPLTGKVTIDLSSPENIGRFVANQLLQNGTATALSKALGMNASFGDGLATSLLNTATAASFDAVGGLRLTDGSAGKIALHALIGGVLAEASGSSFYAGAIAAGANEALATSLRRGITQLSPEQRDVLLTSASQMVGLLSAALAGGDAKAVAAGAWIAKNATQYNFLNHYEMEDFVGDMKACAGDDICYRNTWIGQYGKSTYDQLSQDNLKDALSTVGPARARDLLTQVAGGLAALGDLQCPTEVCDELKFTLIDRALTAKTDLERTYFEGQGIVSGVLIAPVTVVSNAVSSASVKESASVQKAYLYWAEARGTKATSASLDNVSSNIHAGQQGKHVLGHNNFIPGRSYFDEGVDPQKLLSGAHAGEFSVVGYGSRGQPIVDFGQNIGVDGSSGLATRYGTIHSGKNGAHIVPTNPATVGAKP
ncbi:DUF637 domain-containing protein [Pseudomonas sp. NFR16]|uniref:DUF637 domain-containing protein n=1 Tax=Pseudomonas sp. NFR16 TaxID=1566248 RepID=UPI0008BF6661|nr:DUF637 domain-containing protein [Pseudomonas sp. NFR16]SEI65731.1 Haemagluttinin repeat-containing protein [Pseudomonas sp. NFR16]